MDENIYGITANNIKYENDDYVNGGPEQECPDLDFVYDDTDIHANEISELYSYTEQPELQLNVKAFEDQMEQYKLPPSWQKLTEEQQKSIIMKLIDQLEMSKKQLRMKAARCVLYLAQGCWAEMQSDKEQQHWCRHNVMLLYKLGVFNAFVELLNLEIDNASKVAARKLAVSLADSTDLRIILSVMYIITEVMRNESKQPESEFKDVTECFKNELNTYNGEESLVVKLLGMVTRFCSGVAPHFPMKKVILLLWKVILVTLGGIDTLRELKALYRERAGLANTSEDTIEVTKNMRACSPPTSAADLIEAQNPKRNNRPFRRSLIKQSSLDEQQDPTLLGLDVDCPGGPEPDDELGEFGRTIDSEQGNGNGNGSAGDQVFSTADGDMQNDRDTVIMDEKAPGPAGQQPSIDRPGTPVPAPKGLPWMPKVRQKDVETFLDASRMKFIGYTLHNDQESTAGLPQPIHEGIKTLKRHMYVSLAEIQIKREEEMARNPLSSSEGEVPATPTELLYQAILPNLPQYMIALLKILLAAAPTSKAKTESINIMADVLPEEMPMTVLQSMILGIDVNRHKEIIVKAVSAILLLLLKHSKLNHIYQFEFMSQHLVFANCIPLVLKFFNQNIMAYVGAKNVIPIMDFPTSVIGEQPELTTDVLEIGMLHITAQYSWRNLFSCINLLRILNKLTKWKHSRIMMLVVFKSAPILKRTLKVQHAMMQLYVLKLLKMQTKYLGRQWRKSNMKTISAIYSKVRHRLNDDWAFGNDLDARPWDFQGEECTLRTCVDRFNNRRYFETPIDAEMEPVDNCINSVLGNSQNDDYMQLPDEFKQHYELWLQQEVFNNDINWDTLLVSAEI
uniref:Uncharacterized protein n=1 Tax=Xenopsylla cheopis TaxID=163159 RepID=A0A6M2DIS4_XENCH